MIATVAAKMLPKRTRYIYYNSTSFVACTNAISCLGVQESFSSPAQEIGFFLLSTQVLLFQLGPLNDLGIHIYYTKQGLSLYFWYIM